MPGWSSFPFAFLGLRRDGQWLDWTGDNAVVFQPRIGREVRDRVPALERNSGESHYGKSISTARLKKTCLPLLVSSLLLRVCLRLRIVHRIALRWHDCIGGPEPSEQVI